MKLRSDLVLRQFGDDYAVVDPGQQLQDQSKVYQFNQTAVRLWRDLQGKEFTVDSVSTVLMSWYEVEKDVAERDAEALVRQFERDGLLIE